MGYINKFPIRKTGYGFIEPQYIPEGKDEYYLREEQNQLDDNRFRRLTEDEIRLLLKQGNESFDWGDVWVTDRFLPEQIRYSTFYGRIRIDDMEAVTVEYRDLKLPSGIYHSTIVSSDIGKCCAIHHVKYLANYILGDEVIISNVDEMETSSNAKFGNGVLCDGDSEERRIFLEVCNENGGRSVLPFDSMKAADVLLWTRHRDDLILQNRLRALTDRQFTTARGYYSVIGPRTVIKNSHTIKNVKIGSDAYIKGVNKLKNVTVHSSREAYTQIGEGCEIVNGIVGYGCRIFYGVKAVRFVLSSYSQLKYGARLINSFLGENSTISCCEVLNSLLFPAHEQHHNNSFLCAALIEGQSNMAAGATVGSNHNSRAADGEIMANRGFWPGLCVSLKHNSRFAAYTLIVKGDFLYELDIKIPFSLISNDPKNDQLVIVPGYWFLYNMYALLRNTSKFESRDKRKQKLQYFEYEILAPDTINQIFEAISIIEKSLIDVDERADHEVLLEDVENSKRKVILKKPKTALKLFTRLIRYYAANELVKFIEEQGLESFESKLASHESSRHEFVNLGGQLVNQNDYVRLINDIKSDQISSWDDVHQRYSNLSSEYNDRKFEHAVSSLKELDGVAAKDLSKGYLLSLFEEAIEVKQWMTEEVYKSRSKDYQNQFRKITYLSVEEMEAVVGKLEDNKFILQQQKECLDFVEKTNKINKLIAS